MEIVVTGSGEDDELATLVSQARTGNTEAFDELARRVRARVRRWARALVGDRDEAEDVTQVVLVRVHERLTDFEGRSQFASWLYRITRNVALDRRRTEDRRAALLARDRTAAERPTPSAADGADAARVTRLVLAFRTTLPTRQREVFELVDLRGLNATEAANELGIDPATVRVLLLRARRAIRARMLAEHPRLMKEFES